jgi:pyruvate formate lyase activating enzyme
MGFHKITYHEKYRFATLHNFGCTFRCPVCSYKLRSGPEGLPGQTYPRPERFLSECAIRHALQSVSPDKVYFMGGEPTVATELPALLDFAKNTLHARTYLGHTNGSRLPMPNLDGANVGLKAWDEKIHLAYTGRPKQPIFENFSEAFAAGLELKANVVYVPGLVDLDQIEAISRWLSALSPAVPFHIMGYIPVPGQPYARPTDDQMVVAVEVCRKHLANVASSHLTSDQALDLSARDDRFVVRQIA